MKYPLVILLIFFIPLGLFSQASLNMDDYEVTVGDSLEVLINFENPDNEDYFAISFWSYYDSTVVELVEVDLSGSIMGANRRTSEFFAESSSLGILDGPFKKINIGYYSIGVQSSEGIFARLKFNVIGDGRTAVTSYKATYGVSGGETKTLEVNGGQITTNLPAEGSLITSPNNDEIFEISDEANTPIQFNWTSASDPEGAVVEYKLEAFTDTNSVNPLIESDFIRNTSFELESFLIRDFLVNQGFVSGDTSKVFFRVLTSDGLGVTEGPYISLNFILNIGNIPPTATEILNPADGETLVLSGDANQTITIDWSDSNDPDGGQVLYGWQLSINESFDNLLFETDSLSESNLDVSYGIIASLFDELNVPIGSSIQLFHRVLSSDQDSTVFSDFSSVFLSNNGIGLLLSAGAISNFENNDDVNISGSRNELLFVEWTMPELATSIDTSDLDFTYQIASNSNFTDESILLERTVNNTSLSISYGEIASLFNDTGIKVVNHRVIYTDGITKVISESLQLVFNIQNLTNPPSNPILLSPSDNITLNISGDPESIIGIGWTASTDPEGENVSYDWQLSSTNDFLEDEIIFSVNNIDTTNITLTYREIANLLDAQSVSPGQSIDLFHRVIANDGTESSVSDFRNIILIRNRLTDLDSNDLPSELLLNQNYPNPFNPVTNINFNIPEASFVNLSIYDLSGKQVDELVNTNLAAGSYNRSFNAANLPSGVYIYRLNANGVILTRKMILMK